MEQIPWKVAGNDAFPALISSQTGPSSDRNFVLESFTRDLAQRSEASDFAR